MTDSTTPAQAQNLLLTAEFRPFQVDGRTLTARVVEDGTRDVILKVDGHHRWTKTPAYFMVFEGGRWGAYRMPLAVSSLERLRGHWDGYKAAHTQHVARVAEMAQVPAGTTYKPEVWKVAAGDRVFFPRGMFGMWQGRVTRVYQARGTLGLRKGTTMVDVTCSGANGRSYSYKRIQASHLTRNGVRPANLEK
jgi:hypothetical protein